MLLGAVRPFDFVALSLKSRISVKFHSSRFPLLYLSRTLLPQIQKIWCLFTLGRLLFFFGGFRAQPVERILSIFLLPVLPRPPSTLEWTLFCGLNESSQCIYDISPSNPKCSRITTSTLNVRYKACYSPPLFWTRCNQATCNFLLN